MTRICIIATAFGIATLTNLGLIASPVSAQSLLLNDGDNITVGGTGTSGIYNGQPVGLPISSYNSYDGSGGVFLPGGNSAAVETTGTANFNLTTGGGLSSATYALAVNGSGEVNVSGGTISVGSYEVGVYTNSSSSGPVNISGGNIIATGPQATAVSVTGSGPVTISGGHISSTSTSGNEGFALYINSLDIVNITGGSIGADSGAYGIDSDGTLNLFSEGDLPFLINGQPMDNTSIQGPFNGTITGVLLDGETLTTTIRDISENAYLNLNLGSPPVGSAPSTAIQPSSNSTSGGATTFTFTGVPSGSWVDPTSATGFMYKMTGGSLFTAINGFPPGFTSPFDVTANGKDYGLFTSGQSLTFDGAGVSSFLISGINPAVDGSSPTAFPLQVAFNSATADFTMTAAPEPSQFAALGLGIMGLAGLALCARRRA
jgi:hypothetical protein